MPTTITPIGVSNVSIRWAEPYVSDGLNRKLMGLLGGTGVVRGGRLRTSGVGLNVIVGADASEGDSIYSYIDANDRQFTVRQEGDVTLNLAPLAGQTVYVALYVGYTIGAATTVEWRTYTEAELFTGPLVAEAAAVVILGRVVVPGVGPIPAANITPTNRRHAWEALGRDAVRWEQVVRNPGFEVGVHDMQVEADAIPHWSLDGDLSLLNLNGSVIRVIDGGEQHSGSRYLEYDCTAAVGALEVALRADGWVPVASGQFIKASIWARGDAWSGLAFLGDLRVRFYGGDFNYLGSASDIVASFADLAGTFDWTEVTAIGEVPANARFATVVINTFSNPGAPSGRLLLDDAHVFVEPLARASHDQQFIEPIKHDLLSKISFIEDNATAQADGIGTFTNRIIRAFYDGAESPPGLVFARGSVPLIQSDFLFRLTRGVVEAARLRNIGSELIGSAADAAIARLSTPAPANGVALFTLLWEITNASLGPDGPTVRFYAEGPGGLAVTGGLAITVNARWNPASSQWEREDAGQESIKISVGSGRFKVFSHDQLAAAAWGESAGAGAWDRDYGFLHTSFGGVVGLDHTINGRYGFSAANGFTAPQSVKPAGTTVFTTKNPVTGRRIYNTSIAKCWGRIITDGSNTLDGAQIQDGFNIDRCQVSVGGNLLIDFVSALANGEYVVLSANAGGSPVYVFSSFNELASGFEIRAYDMTGASVSMRTTSLEMTFAVFGRD